MKERLIRNEQDLKKATNDLLALGQYIPFIITITEGDRIRSAGANAAYWADIDHFMKEINAIINAKADELGYTNLEMRRTMAEELPIEHALILYARHKEVVHDILKEICNIPSTTKLGSKKFAKFHDILQSTMSWIIGNIRAIG